MGHLSIFNHGKVLGHLVILCIISYSHSLEDSSFWVVGEVICLGKDIFQS